MADRPCWGCQERHERSHSHCPRGIAADKKNEERKKHDRAMDQYYNAFRDGAVLAVKGGHIKQKQR